MVRKRYEQLGTRMPRVWNTQSNSPSGTVPSNASSVTTNLESMAQEAQHKDNAETRNVLRGIGELVTAAKQKPANPPPLQKKPLNQPTSSRQLGSGYGFKTYRGVQQTRAGGERVETPNLRGAKPVDANNPAKLGGPVPKVKSTVRKAAEDRDTMESEQLPF